MSRSASPLPDFTHPPVSEVVLSLQFDRLALLRSPQLGLYWAELRDRFPKTDEQPVLQPVVEQFGATGFAHLTFQLDLTDLSLTPRVWFLNDPGTEVIQVQQDRFVHNWRRSGADTPYPRYLYVRGTFQQEIEQFRRFLDREALGELHPNQCEVTYVNQIGGPGWTRHGELGEVFTIWSSGANNGFLPEPEDGRIAVRYVINGPEAKPVGRLYVTVDPAQRASDGAPIFVMQLTARGKPEGEGLDGVFRFFDRGHEWVVRGFAALTTPKMHEIWGRIDGD